METLFTLNTIIVLAVVIFSAILHEIMHGLVADRLGDPTARLMGRLTLDPRPHIDPFLTLLLPLMLLLSGSSVIFGGAKPVPIDPFNLREGRKDMALVALAGPLTNLLIAFLVSIPFRFIPIDIAIQLPLLIDILQSIIHINILLAIFNLLPLPPLDGSKVVALLLPEKEAQAFTNIGTMGIVILFFLLMFPIGGFSLQSIIANLYGSVLTLFGL